MSVKKALSNFLGQNNCIRMNCAQSVIHAFKDSFNINDETVEKFKDFGGGKAPGEVCGAFYAVKYIMEQYNLKDYEAFEKYFVEQAGAIKCRDIRKAKKLSCVGCVEKSAEFLEKLA